MNRNRKFILNIISDALLVFGVSMLPSLAVAVIRGEDAVTGVIGSAAVLFAAAGLAGRKLSGKLDAQVRPRIWYLTTFFTWLLLISLTVPVFYFSIPGYSLTDAMLESSASWTTTGIGIYDTAALPWSLQLLRSTCNWLGGVGIILTVLSLVPTRQFLGYGLVSTEFPGPSFMKSDNHFRKGYRKVVLIYILLTMLQFIMLILAGMPEFTSLLTALSNTSTSGLRHIGNGVVTGLSAPLKAVITLFAFLGSVNCMLFLLIMDKRIREIRDNSEIRVYVTRLLSAAVIITGLTAAGDSEKGLLRTFGRVLMQVISVMSTSGYVITDVSHWPEACIILLLIMNFAGACALSTGGGIKTARTIIALKTVSYGIYRHIHPNSVRTLTFSKKPMKSDQVMRANVFIGLFALFWLGGALMFTLDDMGVSQAITISQAMLTNTGNTIAGMGAPTLVQDLSPLTKTVMCILMIAGRLEIYPFVMIFLKNFWRSDSAV